MYGDVDVMRCVLEYVDEPLNVKCKELFIEKFCGYRVHEMFGKDSWKNPDAKPERSATRRLSTDHSDLNRNNSIRFLILRSVRTRYMSSQQSPRARVTT